MPVITVQSLELRDSQKKELAKIYAGEFSKMTKVPIDRIYVFFDGYSLDNVSKGDEMFSVNPPARLVAKFNEEK